MMRRRPRSLTALAFLAVMSLLLVLALPLTAFAVATESEPNGTLPGEADPIAIGNTYAASISPVGDVDWFSFTGAYGQGYRIRYAATGSGDISEIRGAVYDQDQYGPWSPAAGALPNAVDFSAWYDGTFYPLAHNLYGQTGNYLVSVSLSSISGIVSSDADGSFVSGCGVYLYQQNGASWNLYATDVTGYHGDYGFYDLPAGSYKMFAGNLEGFHNEWHQDAANQAGAAVLNFDGSTPIVTNIGLAEDLPEIEGTITESGTIDPLTDGAVCLYEDYGEYWDVAYWAYPDSEGYYAFNGVAPGDYIVRASQDEYVTEYWQDVTDFVSATPVTVTTDGAMQLDFALQADTVRIVGTVTDADTLQPVPNAVVCLYYWDVDFLEWFPMPGWDYIYADENGYYEVWGVPDGSYLVQAFDDYYHYIPEYHDGVLDQIDATPLDTVFGSTEQVDFALTHDLPRISGVIVSDEDSSAILMGAASLFYYDADAADWYYDSVWYADEEDGSFEIYGLPDGEYRIQFFDDMGRYMSEFWNDTADLYEADSLMVSPSASHEVTASLALNGSATVYGTLMSDDGVTPVKGTVEYWYWNDFWGSWAAGGMTTEVDGDWWANLDSGDYYFRAYDDDGDYYAEWYQDVAVGVGDPELDGATLVSLTGASTEVPISLGARPLAFEGNVSGAGSGPLDTAWVELYVVHPEGGWDWVDSYSCDANGDYDIRSVEAGQYMLRADDETGDFVAEWFEDAPTWGSAQVLDYDGSTPATADFVLAANDPGSIEGTVTDALTELPIEGAEVNLYFFSADWGEWQTLDTTLTAADGSYLFEGVRPNDSADPYAGQFLVRFSATAYSDRYWEDAATLDYATPVMLAPGGAVTGISGALYEYGPSFHGYVTDGVDVVPDAYVELYSYDPMWEEFYWYDTAACDGSGYYQYWDLPAGSYILGAYDNFGDFIAEYHEDAYSVSEATPVEYFGASNRIDFALQANLPGDISGTVTDATSALPVEGATVYLFTNDWALVNVGSTDASGTYSFTGLSWNDTSEGLFKVRFEAAGYASEYYDDALLEPFADGVRLVPGGTVVADAALAAPGSGRLEGTVTDSVSGLPIEDVDVSVYSYVYVEEWGEWWLEWAGDDYTSASGAYGMDVPAGDYIVEFYDTYSGHISEAWDEYPNVWDAEVADSFVHVASGATVTIDESLTPGATISGLVVDEGTELPIANAYVDVYTWQEDGGTWDYTYGSSTDDSGTYELDGLRSGDYRIFFSEDMHFGEWYDGTTDPDAAQTISLTSGQVRPGVNATLAAGAAIEGTVTDTYGDRVEGTDYVVYDADTHEAIFQGITDYDGYYRAGPLSAATYHVEFPGTIDSNSYYVPQYFDAQSDIGSASEVAAVVGTVTPNIDAVLESDGTWGIVTGVARDADLAVPTPWTSLGLMQSDGFGGWDDAAYTESDEAGAFRFKYVQPGDGYTVCAYADNVYETTYHSDTIDLGSAVTFSVFGGGVAADKNVLRVPQAGTGVIFGTVSEEASGPLEGMYVDVWVSLWDDEGGFWYDEWYDTALTDVSGQWVMRVPPGDYKVEFIGDELRAGEWWNDQMDIESANTVAVVADAFVDCTTSLLRGAHIVGTVTDGTGTVEGVFVSAYRYDGAEYDWYSGSWTDADGTYDITSLPAGDYKVEFWGFDGPGLATEWWNDRATMDSADVVPLVGGGSATCDAQLDVGAVLDVTVQDDDGDMIIGEPIDVELWRWDDDLDAWAHVETAEARGDWGGEVWFPGVHAGEYWLQFTDTADPARFPYMDGVWPEPGGAKVGVTIVAGVDQSIIQRLDSRPPTTTAHGLLGTYYGSGLVTLTATDGGVGAYRSWWQVDSLAPSQGATATIDWFSLGMGEHTLYYWSEDYLGNTEDAHAAPFTVAELDTTPPTSDADIDQGVWHTTPTTVTIGGDDGGGSGIAHIYYSTNGTTPTAEYTGPFLVSAEGTRTIKWYAVDGAGNPEAVHTEYLRIDLTDPVLSDDHYASNEGGYTLTFTPYDACSGAGTTEWRLDSGSWTAIPPTSVTVTGTGSHTVEKRMWDQAGNLFEDSFATTILPSAAPTITVTGVPSGWATSNVTVGFSVTDSSNLSGFWLATSTVRATGPIAATSYSTSTVVATEGTTTISYRALDVKGNNTGTSTVTVRLDKSPPVTTDNHGATYGLGATVTLSPTDAVSGLAGTRWRFDGGSWTTGTVATSSLVGTRTLEYRSVDNAGNWEATKTATFRITGSASVATTLPLEGADRYQTAIAVSKSAFGAGSCSAVVVATGRDFPDALGASGLAGAADCPVVLVDGLATNLTYGSNALAKAEIQRLVQGRASKKIYIVGGTGAVSAGIESVLKTTFGATNVIRVYGADRYATANAVAQRFKLVLASKGIAYSGDAFVVTGQDFPDALLAGPIAYRQHMPIMLAHPLRGADLAMRQTMTAIGTRRVYIIGSTTNVTPATETGLLAHLGAGKVTRPVSLADRYAASVAVADWAKATYGFSWGGVGIATGQTCPDALAAGPICGLANAPLLLTHTASLDASVAAGLAANKADVATVRFFGGVGAITPAVRTAVLEALQ